MKRKFVLGLLVLFSVGVSTVMQAQTTGKKKKKKKTTTTQTTTTDSASLKAGAGTATGATTTVPQGPTPPDGVMETSNGYTDGLVADTSVAAYADFPMDSTKPSDGFYKIPMLRGAKPYAFPKESRYDIKFYKRIWRQFDIRDSVNRIFAVPGETLISILLDGIKNNRIVAYKDDKFTRRLSYAQALKAISPDSSKENKVDTLTGEIIGEYRAYRALDYDSVTTFEIKEDIFLDKVRGRIVTYIVGICPIKTVKTSDGQFFGVEKPFWLYFPQCRNILAQREIYDTQRDIYNVSYDDLFIQRNFKSTIVKESNPADIDLKSKYTNDDDRRKAAERIEQDLQRYKKDLWKY